MTTTADLLDEYAEALRGSWGGIDGRNEQDKLGELSKAIVQYGNTELNEGAVLELRNSLDVCPFGEGHWTEYCDDDCGT